MKVLEPLSEFTSTFIYSDISNAKRKEKTFSFQLKYQNILKNTDNVLRNTNAVFLYYNHKLPLSQSYPFYFYKEKIKESFNLNLNFFDIEKFPLSHIVEHKQVQFIYMQTWYDIPKTDINALFNNLNIKFPNAKIVYLDWFAPTDLRIASLIGEKVEKYVKKNLLGNFEQYKKATCGDTNLTDYYGNLFSINQETVHNTLPVNFHKKVILGANFLTSPFILNQLQSTISNAPQHKKTIDINSRLGGVKAQGWYGEMRRLASQSVYELSNQYTVSQHGTLNYSQYYNELKNSKFTFSPFGYGEVCWRDYEAIMTGSVLIKPHMNHMKVEPNIFIANETYLPVEWDFSNLEEVFNEHINDNKKQTYLRKNAIDILTDYIKNEEFIHFFEKTIN